MGMNFGELIRYVREVRGMDIKEFAEIVGLSDGRIYQVETNQGGLPRAWWKLTDALVIPRATAIKSMPRAMALSALAALERAGEPNPLVEEARVPVPDDGADGLFNIGKFVDPDEVKLAPWTPSATDSARSENKSKKKL